MNNTINPYIAGPPVSGDNFYGREKDLQGALDSTHKLVLFLATRRMGKTSLCYQINHKCDHETRYNSNLCMKWDLQGVRTIHRAKRRLLARYNRIRLKSVDWSRLQDNSTCHEIIETVCDHYDRATDRKTIILLIDEPETFIRFAEKKEYEFLTELKHTFDNVLNLRVVIVSPPRIQNLFFYDEVPYLLEHFQIYFLKEFSNDDSKKLIALNARSTPLKFLENGEKMIDDIIEVSNGVPFYIQQICFNIFDSYPDQRQSQIIEDMIEQQTFSRYFTSDFREVHAIQKIILLNLVNEHEPRESLYLINKTKIIATEIKGQIPTLKYLDELVELGILRKYGKDKYHFSNRLFEHWILRDFDNLWQQTMNDIQVPKDYQGKIFTPGSLKKKDLVKINAELISFIKVLRELEKENSEGKIDSAFYYKRRLSMVRENELLLLKLKDHLSSNGARSLSKVLGQVNEEDCDDKTIIDGLIKAEQEGRVKDWGEIISFAIKDTSVSRVEAVIQAASKVGEYLIEN